MDHDPGDVNRCIIGVSTELALVFINELVNKMLDLVFMWIFKVLGLLKEVSCWILKFLHLNFNIIWRIMNILNLNRLIMILIRHKIFEII